MYMYVNDRCTYAYNDTCTLRPFPSLKHGLVLNAQLGKRESVHSIGQFCVLHNYVIRKID